MRFIKEKVNTTPIVDTVFAIAAKAKEDMAANGKENVINSVLGSLYTEEGVLATFDTVFESLKHLQDDHLARYAASFTGNPDFQQKAIDWVLQGNSHLYKEVIATPGGTGAVGMTIENCLDEGQTLIVPEIAWGSYNLMAQMHNLNTAAYSLFEGDHFNMASFKETCLKVMKEQPRLVVIINDPCHNPTGYSLSEEEWKEIIAFLNECSTTHSIILLNDIAYIDFSYRKQQAKDYFSLFDSITDNVAVVVAFSISKSMTSYGLRCGAAILLAKTKEGVEQLRTVFEKTARATWSNINNGAMEMFVDVLDNHEQAYEQEKEEYTALLKARSDLFLEEAAACHLSHYPYKEGFFITLDMDNDTRDAFHQALMDNHIYTVKVNKGIRIAVCSLPLDQIKGLAGQMKEILDSLDRK